MGRPSWEQTMPEQLAELWAQGITQREISKRLGVPQKVIGHVVRGNPETYPPRRQPAPPTEQKQRGTQLACGHRFVYAVTAPRPNEKVWCRDCNAATSVGPPER